MRERDEIVCNFLKCNRRIATGNDLVQYWEDCYQIKGAVSRNSELSTRMIPGEARQRPIGDVVKGT